MQCEYGGEVTFTVAEPGYRLRIVHGSSTLSIILSRDDIMRLLERIEHVCTDDDAGA